MDANTLKEKLKLTDEDLKKPLPVATKWSKPFWEGAKQHKLLLKTCKDCGHIDHPPYLYCTECQSDNSEWVQASGSNTLCLCNQRGGRSFSVYARSTLRDSLNRPQGRSANGFHHR